MRIDNVELRERATRLFDWALKVVPVAGLAFVAAYLSAQQAITPHHRIIKLVVMGGLLVLMLRFNMVYSVYLFTALYFIPSGISVGSTNTVLMTLIPLIWAVRATARKLPLLRPTPVDVPILLLMLAYLLSFFNIDNNYNLIMGLKLFWRQIACFAFFYMIVNFVSTEEKLVTMAKVLCAMAGVIMFTGVLEIVFPGRQIIPGWLGLQQIKGTGTLNFRIEGVRAGGVLGSHSMLSDLGTQVIMIMTYFVFKTKNPAERFFWLVVVLLTFGAMLSSANRGAALSFVVGLLYAGYVFRHKLSLAKVVMVAAAIATTFVVAERVLVEHTYAVSLSGRILNSEFEGLVPENRTMTWEPALRGAFERPILGHGPFFNTGRGLDFMFWPHNAYIFYFYTLGLVGLGAFLFATYRVVRESFCYNWGVSDRLGDLARLLQVSLFILLIEQMRTDHQRDDIYPYIVWMFFGMIAAAANIARRQARGDTSPDPISEG